MSDNKIQDVVLLPIILVGGLFFGLGYYTTKYICESCFGSQSVNDFVSKGNEAYRNGIFEEAISNFLNAYNEAPENQAVLNSLGWSYFELGKPGYEQAIEYFSKCVELHQYPSSYFGLANIYAQTKDYVKSFYNIRLAISKNKSIDYEMELLKGKLLYWLEDKKGYTETINFLSRHNQSVYEEELRSLCQE